MENFIPPSTTTTIPTTTTATTMNVNAFISSADEPSLMPNSNLYHPTHSHYQAPFPYACPNDQTRQTSFPYPPMHPISMNGFGVVRSNYSSSYAGLRHERRALDPQGTKVARINRKLARQRSLNLSRNPSSSSSSVPSNSSEFDLKRSATYKSEADAYNRSGTAKRDLYQFCTPDNKKLRMLLRKELKNSDVGSLGRIVLPKRESEGNLPALSDKEGIQVVIRDAYSNRAWTFKYKFWSNNKSRMYVLENTGDFVKQNGLGIGDSFVIYEDESKNLYFTITKVKKPVAESSNTTHHNHNHNNTYMAPVDYQPKDEEDASLALLIEQLRHKEQQDACNLISLPAVDAAAAASLRNPNTPAASYDHEMVSFFDDDLYGSLDLLPDVNRYNFSL